MSTDYVVDEELDDEESEDEEEPLTIVEDQPKYRITKGKYKGIEGRRILGTKPSYQVKVNALKRDIEDDPEFKRHASNLAREYVEIRREQAAKKTELSEINLRLEAVAQLLVDQYEIESIKTLSLDNGDSVRVDPAPRAVVFDKDKYRQWCLDEGLLNLMSLPHQTTNKLTKDRLVEGEKEPDGVEAGIVFKPVFNPRSK